MPRIKTHIDIDASRDHVFAAAEPLKMSEWAIHIKDTIVTGGDGKSAGTTDRTLITVTPRTNKLESEWTEYQPGAVWARKFKGYLSGTERMTFWPHEGGTRVTWTYDYKPPFGPIGAIGALLVMARVVQNNMETSLETLKREIEL
jgi:hypothetical protein